MSESTEATGLRWSPTVAELAKALAKAQGAMSSAKKDAKNPHFGSSYADLASVWDSIRKPLSDNGLAVVQQTSTARDGVTVETTLLHVSGEWMRDHFWLPVQQQTPQAFGSALTYARRYSLSALVGVAADVDDDAEGAMGADRSRPAKRTERKPEPQQETKPPPQSQPTNVSKLPIKEAAPDAQTVRVNRIWQRAKAMGMDADRFKAWRINLFQGLDKPSNQLSEAEMGDLEEGLRQLERQKAEAEPGSAG